MYGPLGIIISRRDNNDSLPRIIRQWGSNKRSKAVYGLVSFQCLRPLLITFLIFPQMVTANLKELGCAKTFCAKLNFKDGSSRDNAYFFVCYYSVPADNKPSYIKGEPASQCPEDAPKKDGYFCVSSAPPGCPYSQTLMVTVISLFLSILT